MAECGCSDPRVFGHMPACPQGGYRQNDPARYYSPLPPIPPPAPPEPRRVPWGSLINFPGGGRG